jgi:hypothetical protein
MDVESFGLRNRQNGCGVKSFTQQDHGFRAVGHLLTPPVSYDAGIIESTLDLETVVTDDVRRIQFSAQLRTVCVVVFCQSGFNSTSESSMSARIANIVVTCTKRKSVPTADCLQLSSFAGSTVVELARNWINRLEAAAAKFTRADELYSGDHWQIARSLPQLASGRKVQVRLWVCSAGYGLIPSWAPLQPYSATFSDHHRDSLLRRFASLGRASIRDWWSEIAKWPGPVPGEPRSFSELAREMKHSPLIFVASDVYLRAVGTDLEVARTELADPRLLTIVSGGATPVGVLTPHFLPCNARLQPLLGGALMSLNVRAVRRILLRVERWPLRCDDLAAEFQPLLDAQPDTEQPKRRQLTDNKVQQFIQRHLSRCPSLCASTLLRRLRDSGYACEQKRFGNLFLQVRRQFHE